MNEKTYRFYLSVPLGIRDGKLYLRETDGNVEGWLEVMNHRNALTGTLARDGTLFLRGKIETLVETVDYTATGAYYGRKISLNLKTNSGIYSIAGEEAAPI